MSLAHRAALVLASLLLSASRLSALELVVTRHDDPPPDGCVPGDCSLREAVIAADATSANDVIRLSAGTYELTRADVAGQDEDQSATGDLDLHTLLAIIGPAATMTAIDANGSGRLFEISADGFVLLRGMTLRGGEGTAAAAVFSAGLLTIDRCELRDNGLVAATPALRASGGELRVERSTVAGNGDRGIVVIQAEAVLENVTIGDNASVEIQVDDADLTCRHCTVADAVDPNVPQVQVFSGGLLHLANSLVNADCGTSGDGFIDSLGGNLEATGSTCGLDESDDEDGVPLIQLLLGPLRDNGGPTRTRLPGASSHAIDTARDAHCLDDDQRGADRPNSSCDRGAVERTPTAPPTPLFLDGFEAGNPGAWAGTAP